MTTALENWLVGWWHQSCTELMYHFILYFSNFYFSNLIVIIFLMWGGMLRHFIITFMNFWYIEKEYLPEVWKRPREAYLESWFSWRSQKSIFSRGTTKFFLEVAIMVGYFLNFFQIFICRGRASTNGSKSLETCCRGLLKIGYFDGL